MSYDLNRCPQNEDEFRQYFYTLIGRTIGTPANDWREVIIAAKIPRGFGPGIRADASFPMFGLTQQWSGGPKTRIFLPASQADENGYYTRAIQYIKDLPGGQHGTDFLWSWDYIAGHGYTPVKGVEEPTEPTEPTEPGTEYHEFAGSASARFCNQCGEKRDAAIHQKPPEPEPKPEPGSEGSQAIIAAIEKASAAEVAAIDRLREDVTKSVRDFGKLLPGIIGNLGGLGGLFGNVTKPTRKSSKKR